ncbi:hypothetical protein CYMTET_7569 [Cymbomonas tetramitiformis]|uniref:Uncharacterized protein n=1 Tax=Cymbomonas tetramitiformis TaxID=36881 RepID=A0AAE0LGS0_9CHLO|nr:hypothetical protein CYMTET_7569 [Cymbomonas tetramitiformis]
MQRSKSNGGIGGNDGNGSGGGGSDDDPKLYPQRWIQLGYLSGLALISDWVCFSVAATPGTWDALYHRNASTLVDIFLFTNVAACFVEPAVVNKFGLRKVVVMAAAVMTVGCALRSGVVPATFFPGAVMPDYATEVAGTVLVGAAQPFFQCTPSQLSATWFGKSERALATAVAINANQIGIATSFLVGGIMAQSEAGLNSYFSLITVCSATLTVGALLQFQEKPPTPPSSSAAEEAVFQGSFLEQVRPSMCSADGSLVISAVDALNRSESAVRIVQLSGL